MAEKNIVVTGGGGLVGSEINCGIKINSKDFDLRKQEDCVRMFNEHKPTHIIHAAGTVGGIGGNLEYKGKFFYDNIMINTNMIHYSMVFGVKKLISFLSTCVFPNDVQYPLTENKIHLGPPHDSNYPYAYAKRMADIQTRAYRENYGVDFSCVIPTNMYGVNDNFSLDTSHVIPMLIHKTYLAEKNKTDLVVWGTGKAKREFLYSKDAALLSEWALYNYNEDEPIIFSNSEEISISEVVELITKEFNFKGKIVFDKTKPEGQIRKPSSNNKLKNYLPDFNFTPIEVGLHETINSFIKNYNHVRK